MTDFSRNQIGSVSWKGNQIDRWVIPNDRQLLLRSKYVHQMIHRTPTSVDVEPVKFIILLVTLSYGNYFAIYSQIEINKK